jgi:hypothetical protein
VTLGPPSSCVTGAAAASSLCSSCTRPTSLRPATWDVLRHGVLTYCCQHWIQQQENSSLSIPEALWPKLSEQVRQMAGLKIFAGLGMIDGPAQRGLRHGG